TDPELVRGDASIPTIVRQLIDLEHAVADNLTTFDAVEAEIAAFEAAEEWSYSGNPRKQPYADVSSAVAAVSATSRCQRQARAFHEEKRRKGLIEFSDQLALAVETVSRSRAAIETVRRRFPVVLLDEVQDTSVGQTRLLASLFAGNAVMAVGDPHQSI